MTPAVSRDIHEQQLAPTAHPALPQNASDLWLVPSERDRAARASSQHQPLTEAAARFRADDYHNALRLASSPALHKTPLAPFARYYQGMSQLRLGQTAEARRTFDALLDDKPAGYLAVGAALAAGEAAEAAGDYPAAAKLYARLAGDKHTVSEEVLDRLGRAALAAGENVRATDSYLCLLCVSRLALAGSPAAGHPETLQPCTSRPSYREDMGRAQGIWGARRYAEAKAAYQSFSHAVSGDERGVADLRIAESEFH